MSEKEEPVKIGPWTRLRRREVYDNAWIQLTHDDVLTPRGTPGIYGKIHFKNRAIGIIPLDGDGNTWLVGQYRYALDAYSWEIPMGGGPLDVEPLAAAQRELEEEAGLTGGDWTLLFRLHTSNSVTDEEGCVYLAENLQPGQQALEDSEGDLVLRKLPLAEAIAMVDRGEITDLISIAGLLAVERHRRAAQGL